MQKIPITVIILTKNEQSMIVQCIETVQWAQEIIVIDSRSTDLTVQLAKRAGAIVYTSDKNSFEDRRNYAISKVRTPWMFYLDADERVTPELADQLSSKIQEPNIVAIRFWRKNIHYGKELIHGGWENDSVTRAFKVETFSGWMGKIHESPQYKGVLGEVSEPLIHLTHRSMVDGLQKTISWTGLEAELLFNAGVPTVGIITLFRKSFMEFFRRSILWGGWKDGIEGWIEALVQGMNKFIVYERLWELQQKPSLEKKYQKIDEDILKLWKEKKS